MYEDIAQKGLLKSIEQDQQRAKDALEADKRRTEEQKNDELKKQKCLQFKTESVK